MFTNLHEGREILGVKRALPWHRRHRVPIPSRVTFLVRVTSCSFVANRFKQHAQSSIVRSKGWPRMFTNLHELGEVLGVKLGIAQIESSSRPEFLPCSCHFVFLRG